MQTLTSSKQIGLLEEINILNTPSSSLWATESRQSSGQRHCCWKPQCCVHLLWSHLSLLRGAQHLQSRDLKRLQWSARNRNDWTNPCFLILLPLHWNSFLPLLCSCSILQLLLARTSDPIYWHDIVNCELLLLRLGFELPEQLRFVKLNEWNLGPEHFADVGHCKPEIAVSFPRPPSLSAPTYKWEEGVS